MRYSIITINYNNRDGLRKTIETIVNQTCVDFEFIVIDGGSVDGSLEVIKEYADKIDYWVSESDNGTYDAMNKGIARSSGEYLNFMNSGDCFHAPTVLEMVKSYTEDIIFGDIYRMDTGEVKKFHEITSFYSLCVPEFNHQAMFFKRKLFEMRQYDTSLKIVADWKFILQCIYLDNCTHRHMDLVIADYECGGISADSGLVTSERHRVLKELLPPLLYNDYVAWTGVKVPVMYKLPLLANSYRALCVVNAFISAVLVVLKKIRK